MQLSTTPVGPGKVPGAENAIIADVKQSAHILAMQQMEEDEK